MCTSVPHTRRVARESNFIVADVGQERLKNKARGQPPSPALSRRVLLRVDV
jgi:hypothetical protein